MRSFEHKLICLFIFCLTLIKPLYSQVINGKIIAPDSAEDYTILNYDKLSIARPDKNGNFSINGNETDRYSIKKDDDNKECFIEIFQNCIIEISNLDKNYYRLSSDYSEIAYKASLIYSRNDYKGCVDYCTRYLKNALLYSPEYVSNPYKHYETSVNLGLLPCSENFATICYIGGCAAFQRRNELLQAEYESNRITTNFGRFSLESTALDFFCLASCCGYELIKRSDVPSMEPDRLYWLVDLLQTSLNSQSNSAELMFQDVKHQINQLKLLNLAKKKIFKYEDAFRNAGNDTYLYYLQTKLSSDYLFKSQEARDLLACEYIETLSDYLSSSTEIQGSAADRITYANSLVKQWMKRSTTDNTSAKLIEFLLKSTEMQKQPEPSNMIWPTYSLDSIQKSLKDGECIIFHWDQIRSSELSSYYVKIDSGSSLPEYHWCGYNAKATPRFEDYDSAKRIFYIGHPRTSFLDIAQNDSRVVRLSSISDFLSNRECSKERKAVFIGDINYNLSSMPTPSVSKSSFEPLYGSALELEVLDKLFGDNLKVIRGDDATKFTILHDISTTEKIPILHISTHGEYHAQIQDVNIYRPASYYLSGNDVLNNARLILSGYNNHENSSATILTAKDISDLKHLNIDFVFLNACNSGSGETRYNNSYSFIEAFHEAGVKVIIAFLEPVDDILAAEFTDSFYSRVLEGSNYHDAFFDAKETVLPNAKIILWE